MLEHADEGARFGNEKAIGRQEFSSDFNNVLRSEACSGWTFEVFQDAGAQVSNLLFSETGSWIGTEAFQQRFEVTIDAHCGRGHRGILGPCGQLTRWQTD